MFRKLLKWGLLIIGLAGILGLPFEYSFDSSATVVVYGKGAVQTDVGVPVSIEISSIGLDAGVEKVALTVNGSLAVPKHVLNTGWYELGPRPGEIGSAIIDGHVNWLYGATAVFANVHKLKPGDKIAVQDDKGVLTLFVVRESRSYDAGANAADVFSSNDGKAHLNLITCEGTWNESAKEYSKRLVVFADKEM